MQIDIFDINFSPIFNQAANSRTWPLFTEIEMECQTKKYHYNLNDDDRTRILKTHAQEWENFKYNFAFAAYHYEKMVGFANGYFIDDKDGKSMYLHNLYVLPEYNGLGIGKSLLRYSEQTAQLVVNNMTIVSLDGATSFYKQCGYTSSNNRLFRKNLTASLIGTVPVFRWQRFKNLKNAVDFDRSLFVKNPYAPKFVYVAPNKEIVGAAIKTPDNENHVFVTDVKGKTMTDFYTRDLLSALSRVR